MAEVYEMMMKLGLEGSAMAGLANISTVLTQMHGKVGQIEKAFGGWKIPLGIASGIIGIAMIGGMEKLIKRTAEYSDELAKLKNISPEMSAAVMSGAVPNKAFDLQKSTNLKVPDLMKILGVAAPIFGLKEAEEIWKPLADYAWAQQNQTGFKGEAGADLMKAIRSGELMGRFTDRTTGAIDLPKVKEFLDILNQVIAGSHGSVNAGSLLALAQGGGVYTRGLSGIGLIHEAVIAQAMGGARTGTAYMSLWQQMAGGTMFNRTAEGMEEMGLLHKGEWHSKGGRVIIDEEASKRLTGLISQDPMILAQIYKKHFADMSESQVAAGGQPISPEDQMRMVMRSMNRQTTQRMTSEMVANYEQMMREGERWMQGAGVDQANKNWNETSVTANLQAMSNAWDTLLVAVGGPQSENVIKFLQSLTGTIQSMTDYTRSMDPKVIESIGVGILALGGAFIGAGAVALLAAIGPVGWLIAGITALGAASAAPGLREWMQSTSIMDTITAKLGAFGTTISTLAGMQWDALTGGLSKIYGWLQSIKELFNLRNYMAPPLPKNGGGTGSWEDGVAPKVEKQSFFDPQNKKQILQPMQIDFKIDGRSFGQAVGDIIEDLTNHPTSASASNGWNSYRSSGGGRTDT